MEASKHGSFDSVSFTCSILLLSQLGILGGSKGIVLKIGKYSSVMIKGNSILERIKCVLDLDLLRRNRPPSLQNLQS